MLIAASRGGFGAILTICTFAVVPLTVEAQNNTSNGSNVSTTPVCYTDCCDRPELRFEARMACLSLQQWGIEEAKCVIWEINAVRSCNLYCSNCTDIATAMKDQCLFFLQDKMLFPEAVTRCTALGNDFHYNGRCDSACGINQPDDCFTDQGKYCMSNCGNYQACECFQIRGTWQEPDLCRGETVLDGLMPGTELEYSCVHTPRLCKNHLAPQSECAKYKHCKLDMCLVKNITCAVTDDCQAYGVCEKSTGNCFYTLKDDGVSCNDGLYYTHEDTCVAGTCVGWVDRCLRDGVECDTTNPCLKPEGSCSPRTGACVFDKQQDGMPCPFQPGDPLNGQCSAGVCRRPVVDPCLNETCPLADPGHCEKALYPRCDPETGHCRSIWRPEGFKCEDGDPNTVNDMCIEGHCVGDTISSPAFESIGEGHCANKSGHTYQRYFHDAFNEDACAAQCRRDPACVAYGFGYHQCSIYGTARAVHPQISLWGVQWYLGDSWGDMSVASVSNGDDVQYVLPLQPDEPIVHCMRKRESSNVEETKVNTPIGHEIAFGFMMFLLAFSPAFFYCMIKVKRKLVAYEEQYLLDHENDERDLTHGRSCCNLLRNCRCKHRSGTGDDISPVHSTPEILVKPASAPQKTLDNQQLQIEPLHLDTLQISPLKPALSPREASKGSVAMAPNNEALDNEARDDNAPNNEAPNNEVRDDDFRDPRGQVDGPSEKKKKGGLWSGLSSKLYSKNQYSEQYLPRLSRPMR